MRKRGCHCVALGRKKGREAERARVMSRQLREWCKGRATGRLQVVVTGSAEGSRGGRASGCALVTNIVTAGARRRACRDCIIICGWCREARVVAAYLRSSRKDDPGAAKAAKVARTWLCVLTARHDDVRRALSGCTRPGHRRVLRALDPSCASQRAALELALKAAPPLLIDVLRGGRPGLSRTAAALGRRF